MVRAKSAEQALDEEIRHLREAYIEASQYQELYNDLQEQHGMVLAREAAATEEAKRLAAHNAELAGHSNEVQKISYVEGARREMTKTWDDRNWQPQGTYSTTPMTKSKPSKTRLRHINLSTPVWTA